MCSRHYLIDGYIKACIHYALWRTMAAPSVREEHLQKPGRAGPASSAHNTRVPTGTFQRELADRSGVSQPTFSRVMLDVLGGIIGLSQQYIKFPYTVNRQIKMRNLQQCPVSQM